MRVPELAHHPEKACPALDAGCAAVFRKDHAQTINESAILALSFGKGVGSFGDSWMTAEGRAPNAAGTAGLLSIAPFPIDDILERPARDIGAQIIAEEVCGTVMVLIAGRRDMRRDQHLGIRPEP